MIILEDDLEKLMVSKEPTELTVEGYQDLSHRLHHLQPHMQASSGCWEDTVCQVERMLRRVNACPGELALDCDGFLFNMKLYTKGKLL